MYHIKIPTISVDSVTRPFVIYALSNQGVFDWFRVRSGARQYFVHTRRHWLIYGLEIRGQHAEIQNMGDRLLSLLQAGKPKVRWSEINGWIDMGFSTTILTSMFSRKNDGPDFDFCGYGLVCFHIEALDGIRPVNLGHKHGMEWYNNRSAHEYTLWIERSENLWIERFVKIHAHSYIWTTYNHVTKIT